MPRQEVKVTPAVIAEVEVKNLSPNVLSYAIYTRKAGDTAWSQPIRGDILSNEAQAEKHSIGAVSEGDELFVSLGFAGAPGGPYKGEVDVLQGGVSVGASGTFFREGIRPKKEKFAIPGPCEGVFRAS